MIMFNFNDLPTWVTPMIVIGLVAAAITGVKLIRR